MCNITATRTKRLKIKHFQGGGGGMPPDPSVIIFGDLFLFLCRGLYMSDLTFLDNGNPNFHSSGLIKCRLIYYQIKSEI